MCQCKAVGSIVTDSKRTGWDVFEALKAEVSEAMEDRALQDPPCGKKGGVKHPDPKVSTVGEFEFWST